MSRAAQESQTRNFLKSILVQYFKLNYPYVVHFEDIGDLNARRLNHGLFGVKILNVPIFY